MNNTSHFMNVMRPIWGIVVGGMLSGQVNPIGGMILGNVVTDQGGKLIPAAIVTLAQVSNISKDGRLIQPRSVISSRDGLFLFKDLTPGQYRVCVKLMGSTLLDPCDWDTKQLIYTLTTNQVASDVKLVMKQGVILPIRLDDTSNHLSANEGKTPGANVLLGVPLPNGMFMPASPVTTSKTPGGQDHQVLIPLDTDVRIVVSSKLFQMSDQSGKPLRADSVTALGSGIGTSKGNVLNRGSIPVRVSSAQVAAAVSKVTIRITGIEAN